MATADGGDSGPTWTAHPTAVYVTLQSHTNAGVLVSHKRYSQYLDCHFSLLRYNSGTNTYDTAPFTGAAPAELYSTEDDYGPKCIFHLIIDDVYSKLTRNIGTAPHRYRQTDICPGPTTGIRTYVILVQSSGVAFAGPAMTLMYSVYINPGEKPGVRFNRAETVGDDAGAAFIHCLV